MNNKIMYDSFELLYVYIKKIDRCFEDTYFSFTNDYDIDYDYDSKRLKIVKKDASVLTNFFSNKIKSINLIVGKNGCGKTTLFDLIGINLNNCYDIYDLNYKNKSNGWFALYKCGNDNEFYIEGFNGKLLFNDDFIEKKTIKSIYSIYFTYDFLADNISEISFYNSYNHCDYPFIFYDYEIKYSALFPELNSDFIDVNDYFCFINRKYIKKGKFADLYYLATNNYDFFKRIGNTELSIIIKQIDNFNCENEETLEIEIDLKKEYNKEVYEFLKSCDQENNMSNLTNASKKVFKVHLNNNISEGELQLINTYSGIYYALTNGYKNQKSAIILLDEPDKSFHPMWISSFIDNLVKLVESIDNDMKYQFIISTHSPFMLSDVPKDCITCIDIVDHQRIISKAKKSFGSNYYDIIKDTFFLEDSVGMFAKRKINEMIEVINNIDNNINEENIKRINEMISVIDDDYLKNILHSELNKKISNFNQKMALELEQENLLKRINEISMKLGELND